MSESEFLQSFEDLTFEPDKFTHKAHLHLAWIHITKFGPEKAAENLCRQISLFDKKFGDGTKFNKTVTIAAVQMMYHFMQKSNAESFNDFIGRHPDLLNKFKQLIGAHYSSDIFSDHKAKRGFLPPDLLPF